MLFFSLHGAPYRRPVLSLIVSYYHHAYKCAVLIHDRVQICIGNIKIKNNKKKEIT